MKVNTIKNFIYFISLDAKPGENVSIPGLEYKTTLTKQINDKKFKKACALFRSDDNLNCTFNGLLMSTVSGPVKTTTLKNFPIS